MTGTSFDDHERARWAGRAAAYERTFARLCAYPAEALLDAAGAGAGMRVLDVGTGTGTVAALAAGRGATVVAVDAEPSMLARARRSVPDARLVRAALPHLPVTTGAVDAAVANFVLNHVGDPAAAVAGLRRAVRPGGRIAVTVWPSPQPPLQRLWGEVFAEVDGGELPRVAAERDFPRTEEGLTGLLAGRGWTTCGAGRSPGRTGPTRTSGGPARPAASASRGCCCSGSRRRPTRRCGAATWNCPPATEMPTGCSPCPPPRCSPPVG